MKNYNIQSEKDLFNLLALKGGNIVCTSALAPDEINQANASGRMWVDSETSCGFVWEPEIRRFPMTDEEVEEFEKNFPLDVEMPESLKNPDFIIMRNSEVVSKTLQIVKNELCIKSIDEIKENDIIKLIK